MMIYKLIITKILMKRNKLKYGTEICVCVCVCLKGSVPY